MNAMNPSTRLGEPCSTFPETERSEDSRPVLDRLKALAPGTEERSRLTVPALAEGEQYRFHFDMTRCIGCRSCEVACNEQNNNPPGVTWRRVGEIEGGDYPNVTRLHLSMACNHCLEPSCLEGCPVDAYTKLENGIVDHDAETCIGCQYCTWSCPYGVPQYHAERRVVTKCHMCVGRLADGELPACVSACPTSAIEIESVDVAAWRGQIASADAPGVPPADLTLSTTRITLPDDLPAAIGKVEAQLLEPQAAHWSLVIFLVLSQASVGLFATLPFVFAEASTTFALSLAAFVVGQVSLATAVFHLGRPVHAVRAMKAWRHSWLSREVIAFSLFAAASCAALAGSFVRWRELGDPSPVAPAPGMLAVVLATVLATVLLGAAGIACSVGIYRIPARPAWHSHRTPLAFFITPVLLGASGLLLASRLHPATPLEPSSWPSWLPSSWPAACLVALAAISSALVPWQLVVEGLSAREPSVRGAAVLLTRHLGRLLHLRTALLAAAAALAPSSVFLESRALSITAAAAALACALLGEIAGRYLFFVAVVPRNMPGSFFASRPAHG